MEKIVFKRVGERGGEALYDLRIDGELVRQGLAIEEVVQRIAEGDEKRTDCHGQCEHWPRNDSSGRTPRACRTPEAGLGPRERREAQA